MGKVALEYCSKGEAPGRLHGTPIDKNISQLLANAKASKAKNPSIPIIVETCSKGSLLPMLRKSKIPAAHLTTTLCLLGIWG